MMYVDNEISSNIDLVLDIMTKNHYILSCSLPRILREFRNLNLQSNHIYTLRLKKIFAEYHFLKSCRQRPRNPFSNEFLAAFDSSKFIEYCSPVNSRLRLTV